MERNVNKCNVYILGSQFIITVNSIRFVNNCEEKYLSKAVILIFYLTFEFLQEQNSTMNSTLRVDLCMNKTGTVDRFNESDTFSSKIRL